MPGAILPKPFDASEHRSFLCKKSDSAALLVHGFPGSPAEMRPLGTVLRNTGWTVHGLMLPGLGADIESLDKRTAIDWSAAVENAVEELKRHHSLSLLVAIPWEEPWRCTQRRSSVRADWFYSRLF